MRKDCCPIRQDSSIPKFLTKKPFDFIFIDGWHTFDYTLVDMFYADRLLRIGGYLLIDDALHQGPSKGLHIQTRTINTGNV